MLQARSERARVVWRPEPLGRRLRRLGQGDGGEGGGQQRLVVVELVIVRLRLVVLIERWLRWIQQLRGLQRVQGGRDVGRRSLAKQSRVGQREILVRALR